MNPFYEQGKMLATAGNGQNEDIGDLYKSVLYQRGYGLGYDELSDMQGLGFSDGLMSMFRFVMPALKTGLQYLGKQAVSTAANIAQDAIAGRNVKEAAREHVLRVGEDIFAKPPGINKGRAGKRKALSQGELVVGARPSAIINKRRRQTRIGKGLLKTYPILEKL
jgi:hypothetical protein